MKKVEKPLVQENKETNGSGYFGKGSGVIDFIKEKKCIFKKPIVIIVAIIAIFILTLIIL